MISIKHLSIALLSALTSIPFAQAGGFFGGEPLAMDGLIDNIVLERMHFGDEQLIDPIANQEVFIELANNENMDFLLVNEIPEEAYQSVLTTVQNTNNAKQSLSVKQILGILEWIRSLQFAKAFIASYGNMLINNLDLRGQLDILNFLIQDIHGADLDNEEDSPEEEDVNPAAQESWSASAYDAVLNAGSVIKSTFWG